MISEVEDSQEKEIQAANDGKLLRKEGWFLGELGEEAATAILRSSNKSNVFIVRELPSGGYVLSARYLVEGVEEDFVEHLVIDEDEQHHFTIEGQSICHSTVAEAVNLYTGTRTPPLLPALGRAALDAQLSISSYAEPPEYSAANKQLQPDIAPLPKIDNIMPEDPSEAQTGPIAGHRNYNSSGRHRPVHMDNSHCWRYKDKSCCHPKNVCHCCFYRQTYWTGYSEHNRRKWYDCRDTGFLRCLLLILMWSLVWPFVLCGYCCYYCCFITVFCCIKCIQCFSPECCEDLFDDD